MALHFSLKTFANFALWIQWAFRKLRVPYLNGATISLGWIHILGLCWITTECMQASLKTIIWLCSTIWWKGRRVRMVQPTPNITNHKHNHENTENVAVFPVICLCWISSGVEDAKHGFSLWFLSTRAATSTMCQKGATRLLYWVMRSSILHFEMLVTACGVFGSLDRDVPRDVSVMWRIHCHGAKSQFADLHVRGSPTWPKGEYPEYGFAELCWFADLIGKGRGRQGDRWSIKAHWEDLWSRC